jgi:hypothetical protein
MWGVKLCLLVVSLGLNNPPRIGFTLLKSRIKKIRHREQGGRRCKMAGTGFHSAEANRALICTADCHAEKIVPRIATAKSLNSRADCQWVIPDVANRGTLASGLPRGLKSSTSHFTSTVPLFHALFIFDT